MSKPEKKKDPRQCYCGSCPWCRRFEDNKKAKPQWLRDKGRIEELEAKNADMLAMLEELEWFGIVQSDDEGDPVVAYVCPECSNNSIENHADYCRLDALLKRIKGDK